MPAATKPFQDDVTTCLHCRATLDELDQFRRCYDCARQGHNHDVTECQVCGVATAPGIIPTHPKEALMALK